MSNQPTLCHHRALREPRRELSHAIIGAPYALASGEFGWEWQEPFGANGSLEEAADSTVSAPEPKPDASDFGLKLRREAVDAAQHR